MTHRIGGTQKSQRPLRVARGLIFLRLCVRNAVGNRQPPTALRPLLFAKGPQMLNLKVTQQQIADELLEVERSTQRNVERLTDVIKCALREGRQLDEDEIARLRTMRHHHMRIVAVIENICEGRPPVQEARLG